MRFRTSTGGRGQQKREDVIKAANRAGSKKAKRAKKLDRIASAMENAVSVSITRGLATFKRRISEKDVERLFSEGRTDEIIATMPWERLEDDLRPTVSRLERAALKGSDFAIEELPVPPKDLVIGVTNPRLRRFIDSQIGNMIVNVSQESKKAVQSAISQAFQQAMTPKQTAKIIRQSVGITEKQNLRIMRTRQREMALRESLKQQLEGIADPKSFRATSIRAKLSTLTDEMIDKRVEKRIASAQKNRSIAIARTELNTALNEGQEIVWSEAADRGLFDRDKTYKVWVTVPDQDRTDICAELDGKRVLVDEEFYSEVLGRSFARPPAHINCRSSIVLEQE